MRKILVMNSFLDNHSWCLTSKIIQIMSSFCQDISQSDLYINYVDQIQTDLLFYYVPNRTRFHLLPGQWNIMEML